MAINPGLISQADALAADPALAAFADSLDERFMIADLRDAPIGMGFAWARDGLDVSVHRHGHEPIFAVATPR